MLEQQVEHLVGHLFRHEAGKMAAVLTRLLGFDNFDTAQDIVQDTLLKAVTTWKFKGIPENPSAWLYTVAKRAAIDVLRHQKLRADVHEQLKQSRASEWTLSPAVGQMFMEDEIEDSQLRMIFACCHPIIPYESQIALTLKTLCGLSIAEIARTFLTTEETISKRLYRAREKIREEKIDLEVPPVTQLSLRQDAVLHTLYLLFSEGYHASHPELLIRQELCEEAIRLTLLLAGNARTATPQTHALLALMCLQASRDDARLDAEGQIILLKHQDRSRWNRQLIGKGIAYLNLASQGDVLSEYHLEAAIAARHALAESFEKTDWHEIYALYEALATIKPGPITEMNKAIACGYGISLRDGLEALLKITTLGHAHLYHTALGDFYLDLNEHVHALAAYDKALQLVTSGTERALLEKKRNALLDMGFEI